MLVPPAGSLLMRLCERPLPPETSGLIHRRVCPVRSRAAASQQASTSLHNPRPVLGSASAGKGVEGERGRGRSGGQCAAAEPAAFLRRLQAQACDTRHPEPQLVPAERKCSSLCMGRPLEVLQFGAQAKGSSVTTICQQRATRASMHGLAAGAARLQWMTCRSRCGMEVLDWGRRMGVRVAEEDRGLGFQG